MKALVVERKNIKHNLKIIREIIDKQDKDDNGNKVKIIAVVKGNGYGLGLVEYTKYLIENGKITEPVRGATLIGRGDETLMNIEAVSSNLELADGICGSVSGSVPTTVGQPALRVKELTVGGR